MFNPVVLKWYGAAYTIPANRVLMAIATVENILTLDELHKFVDKSTVPLARIAQAYGALLRFAGGSATDDDVYAGMFGGENADPAAVVTALLGMMLPPDRIVQKSLQSGDVGKAPAGGKNSSARSTKSPSGRNGFRPQNSGI